MTAATGTQGSFDRRLLADLVDRAGDGIIVVNSDGVILYWNLGAQRIFGFSASEVLGTTLDLIIPERLRNRHWQAFSAAVESGNSRYGAADLLAVPAVSSDGKTISIEFSVVLLEAPDGNRQVAAIIRDVTERRAQEIELRRRLEGLTSQGGSPAGAR